MIVLLAHETDPWAPRLARRAARRSGQSARVLTPRDLSRPGWSLPSPPDGTGRIVVDGKPFREEDVTLVVCLFDDVFPEELRWIREEDTSYVASEMSAFLRFWLASLGARVFVPPRNRSLAGSDVPTAVWAEATGPGVDARLDFTLCPVAKAARLIVAAAEGRQAA